MNINLYVSRLMKKRSLRRAVSDHSNMHAQSLTAAKYSWMHKLSRAFAVSICDGMAHFRYVGKTGSLFGIYVWTKFTMFRLALNPHCTFYRCCKIHDDCYGEITKHCRFWHGFLIGYEYRCEGSSCVCLGMFSL